MFRRNLKYFSMSKMFDNFIMCCVMANTVTLAIDNLVTDTSG